MGIIYFLLIGLAAGWLAGLVMRGKGLSLLGNLIVGVLGAFLGGFLFKIIGIHTTNMIGSLITAVVGAVVLLYLVRLIK